MLVTSQLKLLGTVAANANAGVPPLQILWLLDEVIVGILETAIFFVNGVPVHPDVLTSLTVIVAVVDKLKFTLIVVRFGPLAALVIVAPEAVQL